MATESNSASFWFWTKAIILIAYCMFWFEVPFVADALAQSIVGIEREATLNSALVYIATGAVFLYWSSTRIVPSWFPLPMIGAAVSVIVLKWNSPIFMLVADISWMIVWGSMLGGRVFPWQSPCRLMLISVADLEAAAQEFDKKL